MEGLHTLSGDEVKLAIQLKETTLDYLFFFFQLFFLPALENLHHILFDLFFFN